MVSRVPIADWRLVHSSGIGNGKYRNHGGKGPS